MKAAQKMRLQMTKKTSLVEKADLIMKKDMEHKEIMREKKQKIGSPRYEREL